MRMYEAAYLTCRNSYLFMALSIQHGMGRCVLPLREDMLSSLTGVANY